jgi:hypothetical protein
MNIIDKFQRDGLFKAFIVVNGFVAFIAYFLFLMDWTSESKTPFWFNMFFYFIFAGFFLFITIWWGVVAYRRYRAIKNWTPSECTLISEGIDFGSNSSLLNIHARRATCEATSPISGRKRKYKSERYWFIPGDQCEPGFKLKIYFDPNDKKKFYIDTWVLF